MIDASFYTWLVANASAPFIVQEGKVDFDHSIPWVYFRRSATTQERMLDGTTCNAWTTDLDIEVVSDNIDQTQTQADALKTALQGIVAGQVIGTTRIIACFVYEHSDDYLARSILNTDDGLHIANFQVRFFHRA